MTQFNLADELRRGGTGLLAQAVAELVKDELAGDVTDMIEFLAEMERRAAAVSAGNQAKALTALDEPAVLLGSHQCTPACPDSHRSNVELARELCESREALARVEAERDRLDQMLVVRHLELRKRDAVIEAARAWSTAELRVLAKQGSPDGMATELDLAAAKRDLRKALSALDQAASEAEVTAEPTERIEYSKGRVAARRCLESAGAEVTERAIVVGSVWEHAYHRMRAVVTQLTGHDNSSAHIQWEDGERRVWPDWQLRAHFTWVSDPEATEREG